MAYTEKLDVLDLIINTLKEHEKHLDTLAERLELIANSFENLDEKAVMRRFYT